MASQLQSEPQPQPQSQSQTQIDPSLATGAQIPLQSFTIPTFPPQASGLKALTLTSDIKLDEYTSLLSPNSFPAIPPLPASIESLTLELFSLGYPPGFLEALSQRLPNVKSLVIYSQLFAGISDESAQDAEKFFENMKTGLRALHLLDVFARHGTWGRAGEILSPAQEDKQEDAQKKESAQKPRGLLFLEVSYTTQPGPDFLSRIPGHHLPSLIAPSLVACTFNISPPERTNDEEDPSNLDAEGNPIQRGDEEGIVAFDPDISETLVSALTEEKRRPKGLKVLNSTLYALSVGQLEQVLSGDKGGVGDGLLVLSATVDMPLDLEKDEDGKGKAKWKSILLDVLGKCCPVIEQVEIVAKPSGEVAAKTASSVLEAIFPLKSDMLELAKNCPKLASFKGSILRNMALGAVEWSRDGEQQGADKEGKGKGEWKRGVVKA